MRFNEATALRRGSLKSLNSLTMINSVAAQINGVGEVEIGIEGLGNGLVTRELLAVVRGDGVDVL